MKKNSSSIFTSIGFLVFSITLLLGAVFILITYLSANHFYQATTQRLNKDVAEHIARFTSPFTSKGGLDHKKADSVFYDAMVLSPSIEVYFLDTVGTVMYYQAPDSLIKIRKIPLDNIRKHIASKGLDYIKGPDPKNPGADQVFSAAEVNTSHGKLGYIYVILGSNEYRKVSGSLFDSHVLNLSFKVIAIIIILSLLMSILYFRRVRNHFKRISTVLDQYRSGDYTARLKMDTYNEFSMIAEGFNSMADSLVDTIERQERSGNERKNFIATISHDLRTPLSIARGYIETLKDEIRKQPIDPVKQETFVLMAEKKIHQLESLVRQLFDLSRMESVEFRPVKEPFIVSDIVAEAVNSARNTGLDKNLAVTCNGCERPYWINADTGMIERLIQNLVDNAVKYTPVNGLINISLSSRGNELEVTIENSGPPFPQALLDWIGGQTSTKLISAKPHSGLGLAIVKKILQLHNYRYSVAVSSNGLNQFSFIMPLYNK